MYRAALPQIHDDVLRRDVKAFIGQEATHARAHTVVLDHLDALGVDHRAFTRAVGVGLHHGAGAHDVVVAARAAPRCVARHYLIGQLAAIAAIEHFTSVIGVVDRRRAEASTTPAPTPR